MQRPVTHELKIKLAVHLLIYGLGYALQRLVGSVHIMDPLLLQVLHVHLLVIDIEATPSAGLVEFKLDAAVVAGDGLSISIHFVLIGWQLVHGDAIVAVLAQVAA